MKGIVFTKFIEMVEETWSVDFAAQLVDSAGVPSGGAYTSVGTYDHREMACLVGRLSEMSGSPVPDLLRAYGRYLFRQFVELYPVFFTEARTASDFVASVDGVIHVEVRKLYPDAQLPSFEILEHTPDVLRVKYRSDRHLGDLAEGLIEGCIAHFGESGTTKLERADSQEPGGAVCFSLRRV